jgi:Trypsin
MTDSLGHAAPGSKGLPPDHRAPMTGDRAPLSALTPAAIVTRVAEGPPTRSGTGIRIVSHRRTRAATALLAAVAGAALVLAGSAPAFAIADGTPVAEGHYRFAVKLRMTDIPRPDGSHYNSGCSGALIAPQWIITAGHCFHDVNRNPVSGPVPYATTATIGRADDADTNGRVLAVVADFQSPTNDIAIARLAGTVRDIVPLMPSAEPPTAGEVLRMTGWGSLSDVNAAPATHLQTGQVKVTAVSDTIVGVVGYLPKPTTSGCLYDSGMPYFAEAAHRLPRLVSIESDGPACPHDQVETTGRVDTILPWIVSTIAHNSDLGNLRPAAGGSRPPRLPAPHGE